VFKVLVDGADLHQNKLRSLMLVQAHQFAVRVYSKTANAYSFTVDVVYLANQHV
jgi:hypothetical protein